MQNITEKCVDCKKNFERINDELVHHRCPKCQVEFRIKESNGKFPETKKTWANKINYNSDYF